MYCKLYVYCKTTYTFFLSSSPRAFLVASIFIFIGLRGVLNQGKYLVDCILRGLMYIYCFCGLQAPEPVEEKDVYHQYLYYIVAPRARLIKNLFQSHSVPWKGKRVRLKTRGRFSTLYFYKEDYISTLGVKTPELCHVPRIWLSNSWLLVLYSVRSSCDDLYDDVRSYPWRLELFMAVLSKPKN